MKPLCSRPLAGGAPLQWRVICRGQRRSRHWSGAPPAKNLDRTRHSLDRRPRPGDREAFRLELLGEQEGKLERLAGVEPGVALRLVALDQIVDGDVDSAADALRHFLA